MEWSFKSWLPFKRSHFKFCMFLLCNESFFKRLSALTLFKGFYEMGNVNLYIIIFYLKKKIVLQYSMDIGLKAHKAGTEVYSC